MTLTVLSVRAGRRPAPTPGPRPVYACPGGCGHQVPVQLVACRHDWYRLPFELRAAIHATTRRNPVGHAHAVADARTWFRDNGPLSPTSNVPQRSDR